ncbi:MAG: hypothetical protein IOD12_00810 [Silvanigrellales bacterium]|nr:hypothetical protein [Silvanigrellales bacterium]
MPHFRSLSLLLRAFKQRCLPSRRLASVLLSLSGFSCIQSVEGKKLSTLKVVGAPGNVVSVFSVPAAVKEGDVRRYVPVAQARTGEEIYLAPGNYFAANDCSGFAFTQRSEGSTLALSTLRLVPHREALTEDAFKVEGERHVVHTTCEDPIEGISHSWDDKLEIPLLPGKHRLNLAGTPLQAEFGLEASEKVIDLFPLTVFLDGDAGDNRYFVLQEDQAVRSDASIISVPVGGTIWVTPGVYALEINGTRRRAAVEKGMRTRVPLGVLRIESPEKFPADLRARLGGQPVFAYINGGVLLNLNKDYVLFPGDYAVSVEGSELQDVFLVKTGEKTVVKTQGAQIDGPACPANPEAKPCRTVPKITLHKEQRPYSLMNVTPGMPFLVLEGKYEYGVEGMRGLLRLLATSPGSVAQEKLARLRFKWDVRQASSRTRTDLVRLESRGAENFGRSLDLLFNKPDEVYVPAGVYFLTYFVGDPQQERTKTRVEFTVAQGQTREVVVPIFTDKLPAKPDEKTVRGGGDDDRSGTPAEGVDALPSSLVPLRK